MAHPVIAACGSGVTAAVILLALAVLGHDNTALYDGSWAAWGASPDTPVARACPSEDLAFEHRGPGRM